MGRKYGCDLAYTPMLHSKIFAETPRYRTDHFQTNPQDRPVRACACACACACAYACACACACVCARARACMHRVRACMRMKHCLVFISFLSLPRSFPPV